MTVSAVYKKNKEPFDTNIETFQINRPFKSNFNYFRFVLNKMQCTREGISFFLLLLTVQLIFFYVQIAMSPGRFFCFQTNNDFIAFRIQKRICHL